MGAAVQMAGAAVLAGQGVVSGSIAVYDAGKIVAMLRSRNGGGGGNRYTTDKKYAQKKLNISDRQFNKAIHDAKQHFEGNPDMKFDLITGDIIDQRSGEIIGNLLDYK